MAVSRRPLLSGLDLVPGSLPLITMRALLLLLSGLPGLLMAASTLSSGAARQPYFTEVSGRLPVVPLMRLLQQLGPALLAGALGGTLLLLLGRLVLTAGAIGWLNPRSADSERGSVWREVARTGLGWLWPMVRLQLLFVVVVLVVGGSGHALFSALREHGEATGWTGRSLVLLLPLSKGVALALLLALCGAWALWSRVVLVSDGRRTVRTAAWLAFRLLVRRPLRGLLFPVAVTLACQLGGGLLLWSWRQAPPGSAGAALGWIGSWLLGLLLQAYAWHWLLRATSLLWQQPRSDDLRQRPDGPLGWWAALRRLLRRDRRAVDG